MGASRADKAIKKQCRSRGLVCEKLAEALGGSMGATLAAGIEKALHEQLGEGKEYSMQARTILFNLKATGDGSLKQKLLQGRFQPHQLPKMTTDEMLSDSKVSERALAQQKAVDSTVVKADAQQETDIFTCDACFGTRTAYTQTSELRSYGAEQKIVSVSHVTCLNCGQTWITR